jgi:hypothetical protein
MSASGIAVAAHIGDVVPSVNPISHGHADAIGVHVGVSGGDELTFDGVLDEDEMPVPVAGPAKATRPSAAARIGVPAGAAKSTPVWSLRSPVIGWTRIP